MAIWVIAVVAVAPCQCFSPAGIHTTSPGRISSFGAPSHCAQPHPDVTISVWPSGCVCHAVRAPGSKVTTRAQFSLDKGDEQLVRFRSSHHGTRSFCGRCGSTLFCETTHYPDMVDIVLANMNEPIDRPPQAHFYIDDRVDWVCVDDGLPRLGGPDFSDPETP